MKVTFRTEPTTAGKFSALVSIEEGDERAMIYRSPFESEELARGWIRSKIAALALSISAPVESGRMRTVAQGGRIVSRFPVPE